LLPNIFVSEFKKRKSKAAAAENAILFGESATQFEKNIL